MPTGNVIARQPTYSIGHKSFMNVDANMRRVEVEKVREAMVKRGAESSSSHLLE